MLSLCSSGLGFNVGAPSTAAARTNLVMQEAPLSIPDACKFMADPSLDSVSIADKKAFLASKGVDAFVIAQSECVAPEDNVQGRPELPGAEADDAISPLSIAMFLAAPEKADEAYKGESQAALIESLKADGVSEATISMALTAVLPYLPGQEAPGVPSIVAAEAAGAEEPKLEGVVAPTAMGKPAKQPVYNGGRNFKWQPSWKN